MGLRHDGIARVWGFDDKERYGQIKISTSKMDKKQEKRVTDFNGFANVVGNAYEVCKTLPTDIPKSGVPIRISDFEVTSYYNKETKKNSTNVSIFALHLVEWDNEAKKYVDIDVKEVEIPEESDDDLPF